MSAASITIYVVEETYYGPDYTDHQYPIAHLEEEHARAYIKRMKDLSKNDPSVSYSHFSVELHFPGDILEGEL